MDRPAQPQGPQLRDAVCELKRCVHSASTGGLSVGVPTPRWAVGLPKRLGLAPKATELGVHSRPCAFSPGRETQGPSCPLLDTRPGPKLDPRALSGRDGGSHAEGSSQTETSWFSASGIGFLDGGGRPHGV